MASVLLIFVLVHLQCCTFSAVRKEKSTLAIRANAETVRAKEEHDAKIGNDSDHASATTTDGYFGKVLPAMLDQTTQRTCPGEGEGRAWAVFHELGSLSPIGQHSELLFCFLNFTEWRIHINIEDQNAWFSPRNEALNMMPWFPYRKTCYGITYGPGGISAYEKNLGEKCFVGALTKKDTAEWYFKGCIDKLYSLWSNTPFSLPGIDDGGWWLLPMILMFRTCQPKWVGENYVPFPFQADAAQNCNSFATSILHCPLRLDSELHLSLGNASNRKFVLDCTCGEEEHAPKHPEKILNQEYLLIDRRAEILNNCEEKASWTFSSVANWASSSVSASASSLSDDVKGAAPQPRCGLIRNHWKDEEAIVDFFKKPVDSKLRETISSQKIFDPRTYEMYRSGCYCINKVCQCKYGCDKRSDCGQVADPSYCTWCCKNKKNGEHFWVTWAFDRDGPTTHEETCTAKRMAWEKVSQKSNHHDAKGKGCEKPRAQKPPRDPDP